MKRILFLLLFLSGPSWAQGGSPELNGTRYANQFTSVQAAINDLPSCALGPHCGVVVVPQGMRWDPAATRWTSETILWDYATDSRYPQLWMGNDGEFRLMGAGANSAASLVMNNTAADGDRSSSIVFRTGPASALRNIWQLRSGNYGNITARVNADDLLLIGWQGSTHKTGTITAITNGSTQVVGSGTSWTPSLRGGNFLLSAQPTVGATVLSVQDATHLTLASNWTGARAGPGEAYTITGGSTGTFRARMTLGQNGVYIFNPNTNSADPLAFASHNRGYVFGAPDGGSKTMYVRLNVFQPGGSTGMELRSSDSDAKRKFVVLDDRSNELRVLAADGNTALTQLSDTGNYRVNGKIGVGKEPAAFVDVLAADGSDPLLIYRTGGSVITHDFSIDAGGDGAFAVNDRRGVAQVTLNSGTASVLRRGVNIGTGVNADGSGFKHSRGTAGCATGAGAGTTCATVVTWATPFADANYTAVCSGRGIASGVPLNGGLTAQTAASVTFQTVAGAPSAARYTSIDCIAVHDE